VIDRITIARWAVVGGIIAAVGVAGAATRLKKPTTGDACLCTPDAQAPNDLTAAIEPSAASSFASSSHGFGAPAGSTSTPGSLASALAAGSAAERSGGAAYGGGGVSSGAGFGAGGRYVGARSGSSSSRSAALGGLWRLMSLSRRAPSAHSTTTSSTHTAAARAPKQQHPRNSGGSSGSSTSSGSSAVPPGISVVSDLFAEQTATIPELLGGGNTAVISTPGGRTGGLGAAGSGSLAATPEPGPLFLVGAGLIAIASLLRRRLAA
jgi:hypothetical protein